MYAKTTIDGTAASETALCYVHNTPQNRSDAERHAAADVEGPWVEATDNDALTCIVCGYPDPDAEILSR